MKIHIIKLVDRETHKVGAYYAQVRDGHKLIETSAIRFSGEGLATVLCYFQEQYNINTGYGYYMPINPRKYQRDIEIVRALRAGKSIEEIKRIYK